MKKHMVWLLAIILAPVLVASASPAHAGAGVSVQLPGFGLSVGPGGVGLNIGLPWVVAPAPVPPPVYAYPDNSYEPVVQEDVPEFVQPPELGFYVAVGIPYDLYFYNNSYWINRGNLWYSSAYYNGPWTQAYYSDIPYLLNRYPFERVRYYRDAYYGRYQRSGAWNGYQHFRPGQHAEYRGGSGGDRHYSARPQNQDYNRYGSDIRHPNNTWPGNGGGYKAYRPPARYGDFRDNRAYSRMNDNGPVNTVRPTYRRTNDAVQRADGRPAHISPLSFAPAVGNRTDYNRPTRNGQSSGNDYSTARRYSTSQRGEHNRSNGRGEFNRGWQGERR